jgi:hypothetical protein
MANKALVLAEPIYRPDPYEPGVHYVSAPVTEWPETIPQLLADDATRTRITDGAYAFVRTSLRMVDSVERLLVLTSFRPAVPS